MKTITMQMRLYACASVACILWLAQSVKDSYVDGSLWSASNLFLSLCIAAASAYTGGRAFVLWRRHKREETRASGNTPQQGDKVSHAAAASDCDENEGQSDAEGAAGR